MPIIKSAKKRVRVTAKATERNQRVKRSLRDAMKTFTAAVGSGKAADITAARSKVDSVIDTAAKKNIIHKNKAARKKAQVARTAKAAGASVSTTAKKAPAAKKTATKKAAPKKTAAKKPAVKKAPAKKAAAKKTK